MWNGTAETLNAKPTASRPTASSASVAARRRPARDSATPICSSRVEPDERKGERDTVEEERARKRAEQEVLERGLGAGCAARGGCR